MGVTNLAVGVLVLLASLAALPSHASFTRLELTDLFTSEGANLGDFNDDGFADVVAGPYWYAGPDFTQQYEYTEPVAYDKNAYSDKFFLWADDIDGDGWDDVLVGGFPGQLATWYENSQGQSDRWTAHVIFDGLDNESPHYVDITGDGVRELVFHHLGRWGWAAPLPGSPELPWPFQPVTPPGNYPTFTHGMGVGDVNGDGRLDILEKGGWWEHPPGDPTATLWTLHPGNFAPDGVGGAQMFASDFDGDGDQDVVSSSHAHAWGLYWFEQIDVAGQIDFLTHPILDEALEGSPDANPYGVAFSQLHALDLADVNGDGVQDIVTGKRHWAHNGADPDANGPAVVYWFETVRTPAGVHFFPHLIDDDSGVGTQVVAGDADGDGWTDVVVGNKNGAFVFLGAPECDDGLDNDGDGETDFGANCSPLGGSDCGCESAIDFSEKDSTATLPCDDQLDNDADGLRDFGSDSGCRKPASAAEDPACSNGEHDDLDGLVDFDGGMEASQGGALCSAAGVPFGCCTGPGAGCDGAPDPECVGIPWRSREQAGCGLGLELALLLPGLLAGRPRRARPRTSPTGP